MKQEITPEQFNSLKENAKAKYREIVYGMTAKQLGAFNSATFEEMEKRGEGRPPLMTMGQMIEFLVKDGLLTNHRNNMNEIVWTKSEELVDLLWSEVSGILEKNE